MAHASLFTPCLFTPSITLIDDGRVHHCSGCPVPRANDHSPFLLGSQRTQGEFGEVLGVLLFDLYPEEEEEQGEEEEEEMKEE